MGGVGVTGRLPVAWRNRLAGWLPAQLHPVWADHFGSVIRTVATLVSIAVIANSISFVVRYHYPMAFWDFWNWIDDYQRFVEGHYRLIDLFDQHNEHRIFTTRLFLFADALFGHMNGWIPLVANFLLLGYKLSPRRKYL